jgi:hypothetical protein
MVGRIIVGMFGAMVFLSALGGVATAAVTPAPAARTAGLRAVAPHEDEPAPPDDPGSEGEDDSGDDYAR